MSHDIRTLITLATLARTQLETSGGFTLSPEFGQSVPSVGYLASVREREQKFSGVPSVGQILAYFTNTPLPEGHYFGGWFHDGQTFLDVSRYFADSERWHALAFAVDNGQIAIFDIGTKRDIETRTPERERESVLAHSGHAGTSGIQSHSIGDIYPWSIVGVGQTLAAWQLVSGEKRERFAYTPNDRQSFYRAHRLAVESIASN